MPADRGRSTQRVRLPVDSQEPVDQQDREGGQDLARDLDLERGRDLAQDLGQVEQRRRRKQDARNAHHRADADAGNNSTRRPKKAQ